jgi:hypothetical protein
MPLTASGGCGWYIFFDDATQGAFDMSLDSNVGSSF